MAFRSRSRARKDDTSRFANNEATFLLALNPEYISPALLPREVPLSLLIRRALLVRDLKLDSTYSNFPKRAMALSTSANAIAPHGQYLTMTIRAISSA